MGAFGSGFLQGFTGAAQKIIDKKHDEDQAKKTELRSGLWQIAYDPKQPEAVRQNAQEQLQKLYGPEGKKGLQKFGEVFSKITRGNQQQAQPGGGPLAAPGSIPDDPGAPGQAAPQIDRTGSQPQISGGPAPAQATGQSRGMTENLPNGQPAPGTAGSKPMGSRTLAAPQFSLPPSPTDAQIESGRDASVMAEAKRQSAAGQIDRDRRRKSGEASGLTGRDLAEFEESGKLPPTGVAGTRKEVKFKLASGDEVDAQFDPKTGTYYDLEGNVFEVPEGASRVEAKKASGGQIRSVPHSVSRKDALAEVAQGVSYKDQSGKDIDIDNLPQNMGLQAMVSGDKMFWVPITPNQKTFTVGNVVYAATPYELKETGQAGGPTALGEARTGSTGTSSQLAVDPQINKLTVNTLPTTSTPNTPGARPAASPAAQAPQAAPQQPRRSGPLPAPSGQPSTAPQPKADTGGATLRGAPLPMFNQQSQKAVPLMESVTQVFGDPAHPEIKSLMSFADLADDPKAKERLGKALKLTFDGLSDATGGANVAVGAGPVNISAGGFGQWLQNAIGLPANIAAQHAEMMQKAVKDLTPEEREAYDAEMTAFSTAVGLRSLTKASAAQGSVRAIEREIPLIGVNTVSKKQFYDQMQRLAELSINGIRTFPNVNGAPVGFDKGIADRINSMPAELKKLKDATPQRGLGKPGSAPPNDGAPPTVRMKSPDGKEKDVPADQVDHYKKLGATVVKKAA